MVFAKVTSTKNLTTGKIMGSEVQGKEILVANLDGKYYALADRCTHMGCLLSDGRLAGEQVVCSCHGSTFNVKTGYVVKGPATKSEQVFEVKIEGDDVLVSVE